jgi:hypothetical protein
LQNLNALSRVAMFCAERVVEAAPNRRESVTITSVFCDDPDRLGVRGSVHCRWRAAADGKLCMEWQNTAE